MKALICTLYKILPSSGGQSIDSTFLFRLLHSIVVVPLNWADCSSCGLRTRFGEGWGGGRGAQELAFPRLWVNSLLLSEPGIGDLNQEIG